MIASLCLPRIGLSSSRNASRGKTAYIWISPDPAEVGPTLALLLWLLLLLCVRLIG